jgi:hypothetical protein
MTDLGHRFAGMETEDNDPPLRLEAPTPVRYRGTCTCGHKEAWTTNKDRAWEEIAGHFLPVIRQHLIGHPPGPPK